MLRGMWKKAKDLVHYVKSQEKRQHSIVFNYLPTLAVHILVLGMELCMSNLVFVHSV